VQHKGLGESQAESSDADHRAEANSPKRGETKERERDHLSSSRVKKKLKTVGVIRDEAALR